MFSFFMPFLNRKVEKCRILSYFVEIFLLTNGTFWSTIEHVGSNYRDMKKGGPIMILKIILFISFNFMIKMVVTKLITTVILKDVSQENEIN